IAKAAVSDYAGAAALHQSRHQDRAGGGSPRIFAAVHDQHRAGRTILDRLALRMGTVAEHVDLVEVLARRHVAQREGFADQRRLVRAQRTNVLDHLNTEAALEQCGGHRRGGNRLQLVARGVAQFAHVLASVNRRLFDRLAKARLQKIEIAAFIGLFDVPGEHPAIAALEAALGLLPSGTALASSASGTSRLMVRAATSSVMRSPFLTSASGPPTKDSGATCRMQAP